jgi:hypothetical protein
MDEPSVGEISSDRSVKRVVRDLGRIEKEFMHIVHTLPRGTSTRNFPRAKFTRTISFILTTR